MSDEIKDTETKAPAASETAPETAAESAAPAEAPAAPAESTAAAEESAASAPAAADDTQRRSGVRPKREFAPKGEGQQRLPRFKKKMCRFCHDKSVPIDYKRADILENFITDRGKILPRRITGTCARHQRDVAKEIKRARIIALLPFVEK